MIERLLRLVVSPSNWAGLALDIAVLLLKGMGLLGWLDFRLNLFLNIMTPLVMVMGFAVITFIAGSNTLVQMEVDDALRGRVMAIFSMAFLGIAPLGSFTVGHLAQWVGVQPVLFACGLASLAVGVAGRRHLAATSLPMSPA